MTVKWPLRAEADTVGPLGQTEADGAVLACKCGASPHDSLPDICARGHALRGNQRTVTHGLRSARAQEALMPGQEALRAVLAEHRSELLADLGGDDAVGVVLRDAVDRYLRLSVLASTLEARIEREGVLTAKGRTRASVTLYLSVVDRLMKLSQQLGFERRAKQAPSLAEFLAQRQAQQSATEPGHVG
jgi:hypothetical protein